jgi:two-component system probable response regulator PhcQ
MELNMYKIMAVDDERNVLDGLLRTFRLQNQWQVETFDDPLEALERAKTSRFDLFLSDYKMPAMNGVEFLSEIKSLQPDSMRLILSGQADLDSIIRAINEAGIYRFITKPVQKYELIATITLALQYYETVRENKRLADQVRRQQDELGNYKVELERFANEHPTLAHVDWAEDGSIILGPT